MFVFPVFNQCSNRCIVVIVQAMEQTIIVDELLCFIANKLDIVTCDEIVSLCTTHFNDANIRQSKLTLFNVCQRGPDDDPPSTGVKFRRCKGTNSAENNIKDIIKLFQELGNDAPQFAAVNINLLPAVSSDKVDVNTLFRMISELTAVVGNMNTTLEKQQDTITALQSTVANSSKIATYAEKANVDVPSGSRPPLRRSSSVDPEQPQQPNRFNMHNKVIENKEEEEIALQYNDPPFRRQGRNRGRKRRPLRSGLLTAGSPSSKMKGIERKQTAELFITRLSPDCDADDVKNFIKSNLNLDATVRKIEGARNSGYYSSFHVSCVCANPKIFYDENLWPEHVLYRRWYPPRRPPPPPSNFDAVIDFT